MDTYTKKETSARKEVVKSKSEELKNAEESEHAQMELTIRKRIRQISLTDTDSLGDIARHVVHEIELSDQEEIAPGYHSDDGEHIQAAREKARPRKLKQVKSEPSLRSLASDDSESSSSSPPLGGIASKA